LRGFVSKDRQLNVALTAVRVWMTTEVKQVEAPDEEEEEEEDLEPLLKYKRLGAALPAEDAADGIASACSRGKLIVLGMHSGAVWCLDAHSSSGSRSKSKPHTSTVNAVSIDSACEFYASASDDGSVIVTNIATGETEKFTYTRPILALAMHPQYKATRQHVCGGKAGALTLNSKGWFSSKDTLLHQGEGSITAIAWQGNFIAWANSLGVKVVDCSSQQHITFIDRPNEDAVKTGACRCSLLWAAHDTLIVLQVLSAVGRARHTHRRLGNSHQNRSRASPRLWRKI
jgi:WD40 repeat protein